MRDSEEAATPTQGAAASTPTGAMPSLGPTPQPLSRKSPSLFDRLRWPLIIGGPLIIIAVVTYFFLNAGKFQTTDNAYVQIARAPVSASIGGRVLEVYVHENQRVHAGDRLFRLDTRDARADAAQAEAQIAQAQLQVRSLQTTYTAQRVTVEIARRGLVFADRQAARQQALYAAGVSSRQQADEAQHLADNARAQLAIAQQQAQVARSNFGGLDVDASPTVLAARARLERARLNVDYGEVVAPSDGIVTRVEQLQPGAFINAAQTQFWLIRGTPWIEANFKEDQVTYMRVGQPVRVHIDACPGGDLDGRVASFSPGTGSAFSALPAQNATGNWIKVTQRLPGRIPFTRPLPEACSRAGLSARVTVDVRSARNAARR